MQLLAIHGANVEAVDIQSGVTASALARTFNHPALVTFLNAIKGWTPFCIAISCRVPVAGLKTMLQNGTVDPAGAGTRSTLLNTANRPDELWPGQPKPVPALTTLARAAMANWSPSTHWLHHTKFPKRLARCCWCRPGSTRWAAAGARCDGRSWFSPPSCARVAASSALAMTVPRPTHRRYHGGPAARRAIPPLPPGVGVAWCSDGPLLDRETVWRTCGRPRCRIPCDRGRLNRHHPSHLVSSHMPVVPAAAHLLIVGGHLYGRRPRPECVPRAFSPDTHSVDHEPVMGRAPRTENLWVATGFNSQGIQTGPGVGLAMVRGTISSPKKRKKKMADWIIHVDLAAHHNKRGPRAVQLNKHAHRTDVNGVHVFPVYFSKHVQ